jgi:predicted nucleotidyltransferase
MSRLIQIRTLLAAAENVPKGVRLYLFGSVIQGSIDSDIDLLCVYEARILRPAHAYSQLRPLIDDLKARIGLPVHPVVLTTTEEREVRFIESEGCVFVTARQADTAQSPTD